MYHLGLSSMQRPGPMALRGSAAMSSTAVRDPAHAQRMFSALLLRATLATVPVHSLGEQGAASLIKRAPNQGLWRGTAAKIEISGHLPGRCCVGVTRSSWA